MNLTKLTSLRPSEPFPIHSPGCYGVASQGASGLLWWVETNQRNLNHNHNHPSCKIVNTLHTENYASRTLFQVWITFHVFGQWNRIFSFVSKRRKKNKPRTQLHDIIHIHNSVMWDWWYFTRIFPKYFPRSKGMWKIFFGTLSILGNTVMDLNNVMFSKGGHYTLYNNLNTMIPLNDTWLSGRVLILRVGRCWNFICGILSSALQHTHLNLMARGMEKVWHMVQNLDSISMLTLCMV